MWRISANPRGFGLIVAVLALWIGAPASGSEGQVRVTVVAILASDKHKEIDPKLKCLAEKIQELDPKLTGFQQGRMTFKLMSPGAEESFPLADDQTATVILEPKPKQGKGTCVSVKAPGVGVVTYTISCEKCFPIGTNYQTRKGERLIVGILVEPVDAKGQPKKPQPGKEKAKTAKP